MSIRDYDNHLRPNFEVFSVGTWLAAGAASALAPFVLDYPAEPYLALTAVSVAMASRRLPGAYGLFKRRSKLTGADLTFVNFEALQKILSGFEESDLWLGYGWTWDTKHTQFLFELMKESKKDLFGVQDKNKKGSAWLHGIEPDENPVVQPLDHTAGHTLVVGTTGSGKTRLFDHLITQAILRNEPVVIIDPKGDRELRDNARIACRMSGDESRFAFFHPAYPEDSVRLDPMRNFNRPTELASRIAVLMSSEQGNPFQAFGQMALNNVIQGILMSLKRPSLVQIRSYLEGGTEKLVTTALQNYCDMYVPNWEYIAGPYLAKANSDEKKAYAMIRFYREKVLKKSPDLEGLFSMFEHDREHFQKMIASLLPIMNMLTSGDLGPLLSPDTADLDDDRLITDTARIIRSNQVLYVGLDSLSDSMVGQAIGSIFMSDLTAVAGDRYNYGFKNKRVNVYIDEAAEVVNGPMIQALNKGRGAGFNLTVATQTFADFAAKLGDENMARQVLGNLNNIISLRTRDTETQKYICESIPPTRVKYIMQTQATSSASSGAESHSGNVGERLMEEEVDTIPYQMLGQLPDLEYIALLVDGRLIKGRIPILTKE